MDIERTDFVKRWSFYNSLAFLGGFMLYGLISHGFTGNHEANLTVAQYGSHTAALLIVSSIVLFSQKKAISDFKKVTHSRVIIGVMLFVLAFWTGWALSGPPFDYILGFIVLGSISWIDIKDLKRENILWVGLILLLFIVSPFLGNILLFVLGAFSSDLSPLMKHIIIWITIGGIGGLLASTLSGWPLYHLVVEK